MHKVLHTRDNIDKLYKSKKEDEDSSTLRIASMHQYKDSRNTLKRAKTNELKQPVTVMATHKNQQKLGNKNEKKNNDKNWKYLRMGKTQESESLLRVAQNKAMRINYIRAKIDNTQQNS